MASQQGVTTRLGLTATPARGPLPEDAAPTVRTWTQNYSYLGVSGVSFAGYGSFIGKIAQDPINGTDTWGVSWTEGDVTAIELAPSDQWAVSWSESALVNPSLAPFDTWGINWSESVSLTFSAVTDKAGTDTWSVSWLESGAPNVSLARTDTWAVSWSEAGVAQIISAEFNRADTWAVSWQEFGGINALFGNDPRSGGDDWRIDWSESATQAEVFPSYPSHIHITLKNAKIAIRLK